MISASSASSRRRAAVLGAGISGLASAELLRTHGFEVAVFSQAPLETGYEVVVDESADSLAKKVTDYAPELVVASPGIPEHSPLIQAPLSAGIRVIGEVQLAWDLSHTCEGEQVAPKWLCVTGTNGKTTTVGMTAAILAAAGYRAPEVGNIGYPITRAIQEPADVLVVELSSFQLATSPDLEPSAAICLNIDSDHIDWHGDRKSYAAAKSRVYDHVDRARIFFDDEPETEEMAQNGTDSEGSRLVSLKFGSAVKGAVGVKDGAVIDCAFTDDGRAEVLFYLADVPLLASADLSNPASDPLVRDALAAAALARSFGVSSKDVLKGLSDFVPQGHRRAPVPTSDGVRWVDDSKATNVHAALAAARSVEPGTLIWIVGGDAKGQDLSPVFEFAAKQAKALVLVGADPEPLIALRDTYAPKTAMTVAGSGPDGASVLRSAVRACAEIAVPGDTVLLAPGCASWDQFNSYGERGDAFAEAIRELEVAEGS
ncbi:UDP-N-acetylmuramoyl-L-alanine--D-glutamate ligase [Actinomycetaceae bacterium MB13-C1-2]|nr:UDP-N-acetylmuramoyl-L-alanine--D-glutamate ligase [Actinomycetaceae bacterium MB13-C1-2]